MGIRSYMEELERENIRSNFVSQNVLSFIGDFAEYLFSYEDDGKGYDVWESWHNLYKWVCTECGEEVEFYSETCPDCEQALEQEQKVIMNYYIVTPYFGRLLKQAGEPVFERYHGWIWGRTTFGQAVWADDIIDDLCNKEGLYN